MALRGGVGQHAHVRRAHISVVTIEEIERGLIGLPAGRRRRELERRWRELIDAYADTVLCYDIPAAQATAKIPVGRLDR